MIKNLIFDFGKVLVDYDFLPVVDQFFKDKMEEQEFIHLILTEEWQQILDREVKPFDEYIEDMKRSIRNLLHKSSYLKNGIRNS